MKPLDELLILLCQAGEIDLSGQQKRGYHKEFPGAPKPPIYFRIQGSSSEELFTQAALHILLQVRQMTNDVMPSHICGIPGPGQSFAKFIADQMGLSLITLRKEVDQGQIIIDTDGLPAADHDSEVLLVDNITCRARALMQVTRTLRSLNYQVVRFVAFTDLSHAREAGTLEHIGLTGSFVASVEELLVMLVESGQITPEKQQAYHKYPTQLAEFFDWMKSIDL